jgi:hypothetical protein
MRFLGYTLGDPSTPIPPPTPELMAEMGSFVEEATKAGVLLATGGVGPPAEATRVSYHNGEYTVIDGPFTEAKELIAGYTMIQVKSREEAIEWSRRFPNPTVGGKDCEIEVRQLFELEDFGESEALDRFRELTAKK